MEASDRKLLQAFLRNQSEDAFRQLVERHLPMVLGTARRMLGNEQAAEEVTQNTFALLAKKAASLTAEQSLGGWLHRAARNECLHVQRAEGRRRQREESAVAMNAIEQLGTPPELLGDLEEALEELAPEEHDAVVLRFLEDRKLRDVGIELGVSEDAARMRVNRALDRLRAIFEQRGISISAGALAVTLTGQAAVSVPAGLGAVIVTAALTQSTIAATATGGGVAAGWLTLKSAAVVTGVVAVTSVGLIWYQQGREPETTPVVSPTTAQVTSPADPASPTAGAPATAQVAPATGSPLSAGPVSSAPAALAVGSEEPPTPEAQRLLDEARGLIGRRQFEDAIERLNAAINLSPRFPDAYLFRGNAFEGAEKLKEALADHQRAAELRPAYKQAWFEQSRLFDRLEQYDLAIRAATKAIDIDPEFWQAWMGRGRAHFQLNLTRQALEDLDRTVELYPGFPDAYHYRAQAHLRLYQGDEAVTNRRLAVAVAPDDFVQHYRLAFTLWNQYRPAEAVEPATKAIELDPAKPGGWRVRANVLAQLGRHQESLADYNELLRVEPQNHHSWRDRGRLLFELGRTEEALNDLNRAVQLGSGFGPNYRDRGRVLLALKKSDLALADFHRASHLGAGRAGLSGEINYPELWQWQGEALMQQTNYVEAIAQFTRRIEHRVATNSTTRTGGAFIDVIEDSPDPPASVGQAPVPATNQVDLAVRRIADPGLDRAFLMRGYAFHLAGKPTNALADLNLWLDRHPSSALGYYYRGQVNSALNEGRAAIADLSRSIEIEDSAGAREFRGANHFQLASYRPALDDFLAALKLNPTSAYAANMAGWSAEKLDAVPQLIEFLTGEIAANPGNALLLEKRGELNARRERWTDALTDYTAASRLQPQFGRLHFYRASFNLALGDLAAALASSEAALACADLDPAQRSYLVIILALGKPEDAGAQQRLREAPLAGDDGWPAPMIRFLRGEANYQHALDAAKTDAERAELRTYAGWNDLNDGRPAEGRAHLEWMTREGDKTLMEYHLARLLLGQREPDSTQPNQSSQQP